MPANKQDFGQGSQVENMKLKLTTKSQIDIRLQELKYSNANSRGLNVLPELILILLLS